MNDERFLVLFPDGREVVPVANQAVGNEGFCSMVSKEALKEDYEPFDNEPEYLEICRKLGAAWEEMSDSGHMRYGPKAALVFDLLADYVNGVVRDLGLPLFQVKGTNLFSLDEGPVAEHASLFGDRLYSLADPDNNRKFVMRYAACHQQFAMIKHWQISHRNLPFAAYELADSYRLEQSGECMLAFRTRRLNMPDLHVFCRPSEQDRWFMGLHKRVMAEAASFGREYELLVNVCSEEAYRQNIDLVLGMAKDIGRPVLVHMYAGDRNYYWTVNVEYHIVDAMGRAREIGTVQIDVGNARRFGINYVEPDGEKAYPVILHCAVLGSIERFMYLLMDSAVLGARSGQPGHLPYWASPEQIRVLPVSDRHLVFAQKLANRLNKSGIRAGLDDRSEKIGKKIRDCHEGWVPYYVVIGDREASGDALILSDRVNKRDVSVGPAELSFILQEAQADFPWRPMYFPAEMSLRPGF